MIQITLFWLVWLLGHHWAATQVRQQGMHRFRMPENGFETLPKFDINESMALSSCEFDKNCPINC